MAEYEVRFVSAAAKEFRSLPIDTKRRISAIVERFRQTPRPSGVRKLHGYENLYRIRVGQYRVVYEVDDQARLIHITRVRHRREAYR